MGWILAGFTAPMQMGLSPWSLVWMLPLTVSIAVVYKATKVHRVQAGPFFKEAGLLSLSIVAFMAIAGVILCAICWVVDEKIGRILGY